MRKRGKRGKRTAVKKAAKKRERERKKRGQRKRAKRATKEREKGRRPKTKGRGLGLPR